MIPYLMDSVVGDGHHCFNIFIRLNYSFVHYLYFKFYFGLSFIFYSVLISYLINVSLF